jgi:hypothetical protein
MKANLTTRRLIEGFALFLIGDGVMGLLKPRRHSLLWDCGPKSLREFTEMLANHTPLARGIYLAEIAIGLLLASKQTAEEFE